MACLNSLLWTGCVIEDVKKSCYLFTYRSVFLNIFTTRVILDTCKNSKTCASKMWKFYLFFLILFYYYYYYFYFCHKIWAEQSIKWSLKEWKEQIPKLSLIIEDVIQSLKIPSSSWWVRTSTSEFSLICSTIQVTEIRLCCISVIKLISNKKSQLFWK